MCWFYTLLTPLFALFSFLQNLLQSLWASTSRSPQRELEPVDAVKTFEQINAKWVSFYNASYRQPKASDMLLPQEGEFISTSEKCHQRTSYQNKHNNADKWSLMCYFISALESYPEKTRSQFITA